MNLKVYEISISVKFTDKLKSFNERKYYGRSQFFIKILNITNNNFTFVSKINT